MSVLITIPVFRISCRVGIDKGRGWSVIEEIVLWSMIHQFKTINALVDETRLPKQIIIAAIARLMRFRLVEGALGEGPASFRASDYGFRSISSGHPLPVFPKRYMKHVGFVIECVSGEFFHTRDVTIMPPTKIEVERANGAEIRTVSVEGGGPSMSHETNLRRLSNLAATGWNEEIALIDGRTVDLRDDEYMVVRVGDGGLRGLPNTAGANLRRVVGDAAALPPGVGDMRVTYAGGREEENAEPVLHPCQFDASDLVVGGAEQRELFIDLLSKAQRRVIIHSTFLNVKRFQALLDPLRAACGRGVTFDLLWGAERDDDTEERNSTAASDIARIVRDDPTMRRSFHVHTRTTGSHAKFIFQDTEEGWLAAVGSCNWFWSPFNSVELSVVLRNNAVLADMAVAIQRLFGRRGLADRIAMEMSLTARDLRRMPANGGPAAMAVIAGEAHDQMNRIASGAATKLFFIGCHKIGSTALPGALMQAEAAASRPGVSATVLYTQPSGPLKNRHVKVLREEAAANGVSLIKTRKKPLHGKIVAWGDDDVVVTSLNWASAAADPDFPWADIGIHIKAPEIAQTTMTRLKKIFPELENPSATDESVAAPRTTDVRTA
jgi:cardiolipin synthase A/B